MSEKFKTNSAVGLMLIKIENGKEKILLQKRKNTGYMDGYWDFSATGHVEEGESMKQAMIREAKEELDIDIKEKEIEFVTMIHEATSTAPYYNGYFKTTKWEKEPIINEPDKNEQIKWFDINELPKELVYHRVEAVMNYKNNIKYSEYGWNK